MLKVMFVCCAGMSTSLLVERVNNEIKERGLDIEVYAKAESEAREDLGQADILLLGPQVRYLESSFSKDLAGTNTKLGVVDMLAYGTLDAPRVLEQILELEKS